MEAIFNSQLNSPTMRSLRRSLNENRSYAIVGTGALGGFYGARLQQIGHHIHYATMQDLMNDVHTRALVEQMMQEMAAVAAAYQRAIADDYIEKCLKHIARMGSYRTSTKIDFELLAIAR